MTGAGVTSAPSTPVGCPAAAPSRSRCTYVWPLLPGSPLFMASHPYPDSPDQDCFCSQGTSPDCWDLWGLPSPLRKQGLWQGRTQLRVGTDMAACAFLMMLLGPSFLPWLSHSAKVRWVLTAALSSPGLDSGATEMQKV